MNKDIENQEIYSIPLNEKQNIVYAPLKKIAFIGNHGLINQLITNSNSDIVDKQMLFLENIGFFEPDKKPEDNYQKKGILYDSVILFLTNNCQLKCIYCYANSGDHTENRMTWDIAKTSIDFVINSIIKNELKEMTLGFHGGGEPTMNWKILTRAVEYTHSVCKQKHINLTISGASNGYWNKNQIAFITKYFTDINISFDGIETVQNKHRPVKNGNDSFATVTHSIRALEDAKINYGIRMTVTKFSVAHLSKSVKYICDNFKPASIQVEPVFDKGRAIDSNCKIDNIELFIQEFVKAYLIAEDKKTELYYSGSRINVLTNRFCLAPCKALIVNPLGHITSCFEIYSHEHPQSKEFIVGQIEQNQLFFDETKLKGFFDRTIEKIPFCEDCFCKWHCAGDCAAKTDINNFKNNRETDRCIINRELIKFHLLNKIYKNGGVFWVNNLKLNSYEESTTL